MRGFLLATALIALLPVGFGCQRSHDGLPDVSERESRELEARATRLTEALANPDSGSSRVEPIARWLLPAKLAEISGLALTPDGRLFTHNDESARITEVDYRRGTVIKQFFVGEAGWHSDFEGLAYARGRFFLLQSDGTLYEFREGAAGERVAYTKHDTHLGKEGEFEGVAYDSTAKALILACKNVREEQFKNMLVFYRYPLGDVGETKVSPLTVPLSETVGGNGWKKLHPTDITVDPSTGNYVLVAAPEKALVVLTPAGAVVSSRPLGDRHPQAEGIAITRDGILILSDESVNSAAAITLYRWP